jgi:NADH-quinone oxidoreductase subunit M
VVVTHAAAQPFPFLTTLVLLPAGAGLLAAIVPSGVGERASRRLVWTLGAVGTLAPLVLALVVAARFAVGDGGYQMVARHAWAGALGISWYLGVDGISLFLVLMAALVFPLALLGASERRHPKRYVAWMLLLESACLGSFLSLDLVLFFVFFEATLVPAYFLIAELGFERRSYAAVKFFVYTFLGSAFLLVGIVALAFIHDHETGRLTFALPALAATRLAGSTQVLLFLAFSAAFVVKAPVFPFHTWSPDAYAEAPTGGSIALVAVMAKLGVYGLIRFDLGLFPRATVDLAPLLMGLGVAGILYGGIVAAAQRDLKRLLAYSSLAHLGFVVLGAFALSRIALTGGVVQMVTHGVITTALFLSVGWIFERRGTWRTDELSGLQRVAPLLAAAFMVAMLAAVGLPGLGGFVGEFLVLLGTFFVHRFYAVVAAGGVVLAVIYLLWAYQQAFHHAPRGTERQTRDIGWREGAAVLPLVAAIAFLGIYPKPVLDRIEPSVAILVAHVHDPASVPEGSSASTRHGTSSSATQRSSGPSSPPTRASSRTADRLGAPQGLQEAR